MLYNRTLRHLPPGTDFVDANLIARIPDDNIENYPVDMMGLDDDLQILTIINSKEMAHRLVVGRLYPGHPSYENFSKLKFARFRFFRALSETYTASFDAGLLGDGIPATHYMSLTNKGAVGRALRMCDDMGAVCVNPYDFPESTTNVLGYTNRLRVFRNTYDLLRSTQGENWIQAVNTPFPNFGVHPSVKVFSDGGLQARIMEYASPGTKITLQNESLELSSKLVSEIGPQVDIVMALLSTFTG